MNDESREEIIKSFDKCLKEKCLPALEKVLPLCQSSITNFHFVITAIAQEAVKELLQTLAKYNMGYAEALKQGLIEITFSLLISRFNSTLGLEYPFIVAIVQEKDRLGLFLKAVRRKDISGLRESTHADIIPLIVIDKLTPGPLVNFKTETFKYLNYPNENLPEDPTT